MTFVASEATLDDLMHEVLERLPKEGSMTRPTRGDAVEVVGAALELRNPRARLSRSASRSMVFSAVGEFVWYLAGSDDEEHIAHYVDMYRLEATQGVIKGAYGPRLFGQDGDAQVRNLVEMLQERPFTRQAVVQLFDRSDLQSAIKNPPCTCTLQFLLRDGKLHLIAHMRSNDAYKGLPHDIFAFTMLQEIVARSLGADLGEYQHLVGSLHLYEEDLARAAGYVGEGWHHPAEEMPAMPDGDPWPRLAELVDLEERVRTEGPQSVDAQNLEKNYWGDLSRIIIAYGLRNSPSKMEEIANAMSTEFYRLYLVDRRSTHSGGRAIA